MIDWINRLAKVASDRSEVVAAAMVLMVVVMMVVPLNTVVLDVLLAVNITLSILLAVSAMLLNSPLAFSSFPAILLVSTLLRLGLTISSTRLILLDGYAGEIISTFGEFVIAGNVAVGLVLFLIISVVNFIVITKGSERVAEVAARFSLDGMPGKQLSIDSDLRAGLIDQETAKRRRAVLERETQLFGAMDGAIKFVKGDAIAGLIIAVINICGGIAIGMLQKDLSASEASRIYSILAVGDGLVAQIPALLVSIAAGLIVTKVNKAETERSSTAKDMITEIISNPKALICSAVFASMFALIPGMPAFTFIGLGASLGLMWLFKARFSQVGIGANGQPPSSAINFETADMPEDIASVSLARPIVVRIPKSYPLSKRQMIESTIKKSRNQLVEELGVLIPVSCFEIADEPELTLAIHEIPMVSFKPLDDGYLVFSDFNTLQMNRIEYEIYYEPLSNKPLIFVSKANKPQLNGLDVEIVSAEKMISNVYQNLVIKKIRSIFSLQEYTAHIQCASASIGEQIKELDRVLPTIRAVEVMVRLLAERVSVRNLKLIVTAMIEWAQKERDVILISEQVRVALRDQISYSNAKEGKIFGYLLSVDAEDLIRGAIRQTVGGSILDFDSKTESLIIEQIAQQVRYPVFQSEKPPVLVCASDCRPHLKQLLADKLGWIPVTSYAEVTNFVQFESLGELTFGE
ncbi:FHIPEP family type III secretion protein [Limnobacter sp.]|jgi:type III secretion protein V|uniref:FHIPEP family type III secretion protein n=1 Tax=Limnobacter sp. TaxID=2003368 RepID=UPI001E612839|nr:flagellar biosynthesis protein FlhA [Nostoc sp. CHAB 5844]